MEEIAREAGLAKGTIYLYFRSKEELYAAVLQADMDCLTYFSMEKMDQAEGLRGKIDAYVRTRFEFCEARRDFVRVLQTEAGNLSGPLLPTKEVIDRYYQASLDHLIVAIREGSAEGHIGALYPEVCAWAVIDVTRGALERRLSHPDEPATEVGVVVEFLYAAMQCAVPPATT